MIIQYLFILWPNKGEIIAHSVQEQDAVGFLASRRLVTYILMKSRNSGGGLSVNIAYHQKYARYPGGN